MVSLDISKACLLFSSTITSHRHTLQSLLSTIQNTALLEVLKQFRLQELADCNVLGQALSPPSLEHKVARRRLCGGRFEWAQLDVAVEDERDGGLALAVYLKNKGELS